MKKSIYSIVFGAICTMILFSVCNFSMALEKMEPIMALAESNIGISNELSWGSGDFYAAEVASESAVSEETTNPSTSEVSDTSPSDLPAESALLENAENTEIVADTLQNATQQSGLIVLKKNRYYQNDKKLNGRELKKILKSDPESAAAYKKGTALNTTGMIFLIAVDIALIATTGTYLGILPGMLVVLPFTMGAQKHFNKAIEIYNSKQQIK
jgi:hypothetical protein